MPFRVDISQLSRETAQCVREVAGELKLIFEPPYSLHISEESDRRILRCGETVREVRGGKSAFFAYLRRAAVCGILPEICEPAFDSLGFMADCSRNAVLSVNAAKKLIRKLALLGYDSLQLYTEDTYEVDGEPYFGYMRGRYSQSELREIADYGEKFGVRLVPAIQTLAHLGAIFRWRGYWDINDCNDILLAGSERTYGLIEHMISSLRKCVYGDKINIGMDEAHFLGLGKYLAEHGYSDRAEIMLSHIRRVADICRKYGFKPMMWSDMFYRLRAGASYEEGKAGESDTAHADIPEGTELIYWNYYERRGEVYDGMLASHRKLGCPIVFAGGAVKWIGFAPDNRFSLAIAQTALGACKRGGVKSVLLTAWGDNGAECPAFSVLPTAAYYAAFNEGIEDICDPRYAQIVQAVTGMKYEDFMLVDLPNRISDSSDPYERNGACKYLLYNDPFLGVMDSLVQSDLQRRYGSHARKLRAAAKNSGEWKYIFDSLGCLCEVLSYKAD
ncbi:MAG: beta-N-acetylhexosaminidase, partial [Clostridiales bacterium]|nr:beta-N-acetylhexosaminidase [Clostridiales bacterium]